jgi:hypothetical protein
MVDEQRASIDAGQIYKAAQALPAACQDMSKPLDNINEHKE